MNLVSLLFSFQGRITRAQYWLGNLGVFICVFVLSFAGSLILAPLGKGAAPGMLLALFAVVMLAGGWCSLSLQVKRFHDRGRSGWLALVPLIPAIMIFITVIGGAASNAPAAAVVPNILPWFGVGFLINLWIFIDLGCLSGTDGPNKYDGGAPGDGGSPFSFGGGPSKQAGAAFLLGGAQSAMDRALDAQSKAPAAAMVAAPARPAMRAAPAGPMPAPSGSFGRRTSR